MTHYNLDAIISVGYRVDSKRTVPFRRWADRVLCNLWWASLEWADGLRPPHDQTVAAVTAFKTALVARG